MTIRQVPALRVLLAAALAVALSGTTAAAASGAPPAGADSHGAPVKAGPPVVLGSGGWTVRSSAEATQTGQEISAPGFATDGWLSVPNDDGGACGSTASWCPQRTP